jgi:predicted PhzF superfamily epimerase YddE/YHI9
VLWETGRLGPEAPALFDTRESGRLVCQRGDAGWIRMDFPASPVEQVPVPEGLERALGVKVEWAGRSPFDYLVRVADESAVRGLRPDAAALAVLPVRGVIVTAATSVSTVPEQRGFDFVSRFFAPGVGVPEDPVTGSAHCALAPYWGAILGKTEMRGWQASARGGEVRVLWRGDRVELAGQAVTVSSGTLVGGAA